MADPTYTDWANIHGPVGCSRCGALVSISMKETHNQYHRDQDALAKTVADQGALLLRINLGGLGIKL